MASTFMSFFGTLFTSLLNSTQLQSVGRTALKVGGALLIAKYGIDPTNIASVVGGIAAASGVVSSVKAHALVPAATPLSISDVVSATIQALGAPTPIAASVPTSAAATS